MKLQTAVPKPKRKPARPRQWGTTLPHATKRLKKLNVEAQAKRRARYRKKLAAYKRSATYKIVEVRAQGQCEQRYFINGIAPQRWPNEEIEMRCGARRDEGSRLTHHHVTYARFGGHELPTDIAVLCDSHNAEAESKHSTRRRNYRVVSQGETRQ